MRNGYKEKNIEFMSKSSKEKKMKKLLIALLAFGSICSYANEYEQSTVFCKLTGDFQNFETKRKLKTVKFKIKVTSIKGKDKVVKSEFLGTDLLKLKEVKIKRRSTKFKLRMNAEPMIVYYNLRPTHIVSFHKLDTNDLERLLTELGGDLKTNIKQGLDIDQLRLKNKSKVHDVSDRYEEQIHTDHTGIDGSSYHVKLYCSLFSNLYYD